MAWGVAGAWGLFAAACSSTAPALPAGDALVDEPSATASAADEPERPPFEAALGEGGAPPDAPDAGPSPPTCAIKGGRAGGDTYVLKVRSANRDRLVDVHVGAGYDPTKGFPLVLAFHGFSNTSGTVQAQSRFAEIADQEGFVVAFPHGVATSWNAGTCCGTAWTDAIDDVGFARKIVETLDEELCLDPRRVHAAGFSNGGFLAYRLACEASEVFASVASVAGVLGLSPERCTPPRPVPVLDVHGTADLVVPFGGGSPIVPWLNPIDFVSVEETLAFWRRTNGCVGSARETYAKGDATCRTWDGCRLGSEVAQCVVDGGGHQWPGGQGIPAAGKTSTDLDASRHITTFFRAHPMP